MKALFNDAKFYDACLALVDDELVRAKMLARPVFILFLVTLKNELKRRRGHDLHWTFEL